MTSVTALLLLLLLLLSITSSSAEVVYSLSVCDSFFLEGTPPQIPGILKGGKILNQNQYKPICQTYKNKRMFLTLYDINNKIPVFSAYKYRGEQERGRPKKGWMIEPQLETERANKSMTRQDKRKTYDHQAVDDDYKHNGIFDRGHIFPSSHAFDKEEKRSTFTLTNIVPQAGSFNKGSWNRMETCIKCVMDRHCRDSNGHHEGFVVTGAQASSDDTLNDKVNVPSRLWSAFCCYSADTETWIASAHWGHNVPDSPEDYLPTRTLAELHDELGAAASKFEAFPGTQCPLHTTVSELYPQHHKCHCPPRSTASTSGPSTAGSSSLIWAAPTWLAYTYHRAY
ncbi:endonuclease domain-containing 1 protein-like [Brachyistius frenatus]|uniref:endonuclease domain-containing 1 protein-like n=1 Tax=Brachyistius frenatus TaxID=100188 RepID=UPI0037E73619